MSESFAIHWPAPAKLNLFLHVTGSRPDGYHDIQTLFQIIDLCDTIQIEADDTGEIARLPGDYGVPEQDDLVVRAAKLLQQEFSGNKGARLKVNKSIPLGAGLGGGSSDAATTLLVLNQLWKCNFSLEALAELGATLGADIPLFIMGKTAMGSGIGENLESLSLGSRSYLLVFNDFSVSTAEVFAHAALKRDSETISVSQALAGEGRNDCEAVVRMLHPEFEPLLQELGNWGNPHMTGTGSCVFFTMPDKKATNSAASKLKCRYNVRAVSGVDQSPLHNLLEWPSAAAR